MNLTQMITRVTALTLAMMLLNCDFLMLIPLMSKLITPEMGPASLGGLLISIQSISAAAAILIFAPLSDIWGRKKLLILGCILVTVSNFFMGVSTTFTELAITRILGGAGDALLLANLLAYAGDSFPPEKTGRVMGIITASQGVGAAIGIYWITKLAFRFSVQTAYWSLSAGAFCILLFIILLLPALHRKTESEFSLSKYIYNYKKALTLASVLAAVIACALWNGSFHGVWDFNGLFFTQKFKMNVEEVGDTLSLSIIAYFLGALVGGKLSEYFTSRKAFIIAIILSVILMNAFTMNTAHALSSIIILSAWTFLFGLGDTAIFTLVAGLNDEFRGTILSINSALLYIGISVFTAIGSGYLPTHGFIFIGIICSIGCLLALPLAIFGVKAKY